MYDGGVDGPRFHVPMPCPLPNEVGPRPDERKGLRNCMKSAVLIETEYVYAEKPGFKSLRLRQKSQVRMTLYRAVAATFP